MEKIFINGSLMEDEDMANKYIGSSLNLRENLDDIKYLEDLLVIEDEILIVLYNEDVMIKKLGIYGERILDTFIYLDKKYDRFNFSLVV